MLLEARHISRAFGAVTVLDDCSFILSARERVGLVGANGAGKTTLLRLAAGADEPDSGAIVTAPGVEVGYLAQSLGADVHAMVDDVIQSAVAPLLRMSAQLRALEARMASSADPDPIATLDEYGTTLSRFQDRGGFEMEYHVEAVLTGLGVSHIARERQIASLSGGERARLGLARLLLGRPDVLLLDEPTNHLDLAALRWLEEYLASSSAAMLIASHDRHFLNRTVTRILEIDDHTHRLRSYEGGYDAYVAEKRAELARWQEQYDRQQEEIRLLRRRMKETAKVVGHPGRQPPDNDKSAKAFFEERVQTTISRNVRAAAEQLRRIEADPIPTPPQPMRFNPRLADSTSHARAVITLDHVAKHFGARSVLRDVTAAILPGARIILIGPNGAGKTTLLRLIVGIEQADHGTISRAPDARFGYLAQDPLTVAAGRTVLDVYRDGAVGEKHTFVAGLIGHGFFRLEDVAKPVSGLSAGQLRKLEIARMIAAQPNMLVLDEPTNYISLDVLEAFESAVLRFPGAVIAVSHDRWFVERFGGQVWELADGSLRIHDAGSAVRLDAWAPANE